MSTIKSKIKYFPFCPGIGWEIYKGKIIPKISAEIWQERISNKSIILTLPQGGLLEAFVSLSCAEAISKIENGKLYWLGNKKFFDLINLHGLCEISNIKLTLRDLDNYPTPVFFDKKDKVYFNLLNNYIIKKNYWQMYDCEAKDPAIKQIFDNCLLNEWPGPPKFRNLNSSKMNKNKNIVIILDNFYSIHKIDCLNWSIQQTKELASMLYGKNFKVNVISNNKTPFYGSKVNVIDYNILNIMDLIKSSWMVLSNNIDWLIISLMISNAIVFSKTLPKAFDLIANAEYIDVKNQIFIENGDISTIDIYNTCINI